MILIADIVLLHDATTVLHVSFSRRGCIHNTPYWIPDSIPEHILLNMLLSILMLFACLLSCFAVAVGLHEHCSVACHRSNADDDI